MRVDAPRFTGEDPTGWVFRVQKYFDYFLTPEQERFHLVAMLIDHPASEWFRYYQANNCNARWPEFLKAVQQRFDPSYYENYVGLLSKLTQTSSVMDYQTSFEALLNKVSGVPEATLVAMYIAGLKQPVQREVNLRTPTTLPAAFALARELSASYQDLQGASSSRRAWPVRQPATTPPGFPVSANPSQIPPPSRGSFPPSKPAASSSLSQLPIVKVSAADKAERAKKGLCWYCDEKWVPGHHCKHRFLAFMGPDDDDDHTANADQVAEDIITADISSMHSLAGSPHPRSLKLLGAVNDVPVQVLLDGGSTHNFLHPAMAGRLALVLHPVTPFRVYVGNGDSLRCSYSCRQTPLFLQGNTFDVDLFILEIHGPDIVLGVQWLQTLGKVSQDYANLTMEFSYQGKAVLLQGDNQPPRPIAYNHLWALTSRASDLEFYELVVTSAPTPTTAEATLELPTDVPAPIRAIIHGHAALFSPPVGLPPSRPWDHQLHLVPAAKPVNVPEDSFQRLKLAMTTAPVLRLPDFTQPFYLETDASDTGIGAVLLQRGHPIAFFSKKLGPWRRTASTYHKELYAIVEAVQKWRQYLLGREFVIRSDQRSLKELLLQVNQTPDQQFYIRKLMGFKFRIEYKTGASNKAADALSRREAEEDSSANLFTTYAQPVPRLLATL
ncbi:unnamed protein product [Cuscuta campestris]|uniref:Ty3 transposon capsid-like protein domain-containing protein n=1 Tax=Cuscuta campestris TaxID=132261 RepID=A0A484MLK0_9ASTE|nr:unnamed protein product [Cuscuta campestris]